LFLSRTFPMSLCWQAVSIGIFAFTSSREEAGLVREADLL
jgi:hypothetical protein